MRSLFSSVLGYFLTPGGLILLGVLDSSIVFFLPLGIDVAVIVLAARKPDLFLVYAALATMGSVLGAMVTYWIGVKLGEHGIKRLVPEPRFERVKARVQTHAFGVAVLGLVPPPFPFTAFLLASGAVGANPWTFFSLLAGVRLARFSGEAGLATLYGEQILSWMKSTVFEVFVGILIALAIAGTAFSAVAAYRGARSPKSAVSASRPEGSSTRRAEGVRGTKVPRV